MIFVALSFSIFLLIGIVNIVASNAREKLYIQEETKKKIKNINAAIATNTDFMKSFVGDYTCWDELVTQIYRLAPQWAEENLKSTLKSTSSDYVWLFDKQMKLVYACNSDDAAPLSWPVYPDQVYSMLDTIRVSSKRTCSFFKIHNNKLIEICGSTVHISKDQKKMLEPHGFYFFGRILDDAYLKKLEILTGASVKTKLDTNNVLQKNISSNKMVLNAPLKGWSKQVIGQLVFTVTDKFRENEKAINLKYYIFISILIITLIIIYYFLVATHISKSLKNIVVSLDHESTASLSNLLKSGDEFGKIAAMIETSIAQKKRLQEEINERTTIEEEIMLQKEELMSQSEELHATTEELSHQVNQLQEQNALITKQSSNILESMTYASRIQNALFPSEHSLKTTFSDYFILYRPRDIVSGDFYYLKSSNDKVIIAAADCTGHGVPGAFLSMLGLSFLNEIVLHHSNITSNQILEELRTYMVSSLSHSATAHEMHVGMDISVCIIDFNDNSLSFSGAHSPVYLTRKTDANEEANEIIELKADNISISQSRKWKSFTQKNITFEIGDMLYLFTDGIIHQFGGPQNRKFSANKLKSLLADKTFNAYPMEEQAKLLERSFDKWRGTNAQLDDVMVLGFKLEKPLKEEGIMYEDSFMGLFDIDDELN